MKLAIVKASGAQYRVREGDIITVNKIEGNEKDTVSLDEVLLISDGEKVMLGNPYVKGANIIGQVIAQKKGEKIRVATYKAKSRSRRVIGSRAQLTDIRITKIRIK